MEKDLGIIGFKREKNKQISSTILQKLYQTNFKLHSNGMFEEVICPSKKEILEFRLSGIENTNEILSNSNNITKFFSSFSGDKKGIDTTSFDTSELRFDGIILRLIPPHRISPNETNNFFGHTCISLFYKEGSGLYMPKVITGDIKSLKKPKLSDYCSEGKFLDFEEYRSF